MTSDELDESDEEESDKLGSEYGSVGAFSTGLGGLLCVVGFPLSVTISAYESCDGDQVSLAVP